MEWISVKERLPKEPGWYKVKIRGEEFKVPYSNTLSGKLVWVIPDLSSVTHWIYESKKQ